ncbi:hypothetical protein [Parabacteroides pacaensis]|uniref:hypothetical protein n=1 Tax=Parabacteroides pacaensis TaxID=2086575 RepID=UPI000D1147B0|nr:hypothetical protein [Parabacteroides pacaensis]
MNKRFVLVLGILCLIFWGGKKMRDNGFFMNKVCLPFAYNTIKDGFLRGDSLRCYSVTLDSIWKEGMDKVLLVPPVFSDESLMKADKLLRDHPTLYNDSTTLIIFPGNSSSATAFAGKYPCSLLPLHGKNQDFVFLNDIGEHILVANVKKQKGRKNQPGKFWYILSLDRVL